MIWRLAWWLISAASWKLSWGCHLDFFCVVSPHGLNFLTTWQLGSKGKGRQTETETGGSHIAPYMTDSFPPHSVSRSSYKDVSEFRGRECRLPPLEERTLWEDQVGWDIYCSGHCQSTGDQICHRFDLIYFPAVSTEMSGEADYSVVIVHNWKHACLHRFLRMTEYYCLAIWGK